MKDRKTGRQQERTKECMGEVKKGRNTKEIHTQRARQKDRYIEITKERNQERSTKEKKK